MWKNEIAIAHAFEQQLRYQLATAAFGAVASLQVLAKDDPQIATAIASSRARGTTSIAFRRGRVCHNHNPDVQSED